MEMKFTNWLESAFIVLFYFCTTLVIYSFLNQMFNFLGGLLK